MTIDRQPIAFLVGLIALGAACSSSSLGGGADAATCTDLMNQYVSALAQANVCDPTAANQCQQPVQGLICNNCNALVQEPTAADAIVTKMINLGCVHLAGCACTSPQTYTCAPADGGGGICMGSFAAPH